MTYANLCPTHGARPVGWRTMVPAGVFSLNTKNLTGKVWVAERTFLHNGHPTNYLPRSCREAERVSRLLRGAMGRPVAVRGMLVVMCDEFTLKAQPLGVVVVRRRAVNEWLLKQPVSLTPREITEIARKAHLPDTWVRRA